MQSESCYKHFRPFERTFKTAKIHHNRNTSWKHSKISDDSEHIGPFWLQYLDDPKLLDVVIQLAWSDSQDPARQGIVSAPNVPITRLTICSFMLLNPSPIAKHKHRI